ncbi:MAG: hypothetical protein QOC76_5086 [Mycobacterium sp.]|jgi:hypothetical protein|nr:hypothetical protein [Mycobacterium sp.]
MVTNSVVLIVVAAFATLVLALVAYATLTHERRGKCETIRDQAEEALACSLQHRATAYRSEAVTSRDQLNEQRVHRLVG